MIALELRVVSLSSARSFRTRTMGLCRGRRLEMALQPMSRGLT
jgi:hypothetical protein